MSKADCGTNGSLDGGDVVFRIGVGILLGLITVSGLILAMPVMYRLGPAAVADSFVLVLFIFLNTLVVACALRLATFMVLRDCSRMSIAVALVIIGLGALGIQWFTYDTVVGVLEEVFDI